ncbi:hypothetical protein [Kribbella sp. CA-247076]|uniref:hypothetical protein n=1 Tax=Kribbella sp. CA-247076 TaxID=3239941 RepID=UPI003D8A7B87
MSTPADERAAVQAREHAGNLAEMTVNAVTSARASLESAAELTDQVDRRLRWAEDDIASVAGMANRVRDAENTEDAEAILRNARYAADEIRESLRRGQGGVAEVREHLEQGARSLAAGRQFMDELDSMPGQRSEVNDQLRTRLVALSRAVDDAMEGTDRTNQRLAAARENLEPLLNVPGAIEDQDRTARVVQEAGTEAEYAVGTARRGLGELREGFENTSPDARRIAHDSDELATAIRAGTNPTQPSEQTKAGATAEDPRRAWSEGRDPSKTLDL